MDYHVGHIAYYHTDGKTAEELYKNIVEMALEYSTKHRSIFVLQPTTFENKLIEEHKLA